MASKFEETPEQRRAHSVRAGKKAATIQKMDKAFGWKKYPRERTRLSVRDPKRKGDSE